MGEQVSEWVDERYPLVKSQPWKLDGRVDLLLSHFTDVKTEAKNYQRTFLCPEKVMARTGSMLFIMCV